MGSCQAAAHQGIAKLSFPYNSKPWRPLTSLESSEDHAHYRVVSNSVPVTDNIHGDTRPLRSQLGLPAGPRFVLDHLLNTATDEQILAVLQQRNHPLQDNLLADIQQTSELVLNQVTDMITANQTSQEAFRTLTQWLKRHPWVMVQNSKFVCTSQLCFDLDADSAYGEIYAADTFDCRMPADVPNYAELKCYMVLPVQLKRCDSKLIEFTFTSNLLMQCANHSRACMSERGRALLLEFCGVHYCIGVASAPER